jgi:PAS domain S-box-containing protein
MTATPLVSALELIRSKAASLLGARERERAEQRLRAANARIELILNAITDRFFAFSSDWRYTYMNKHAAAQLVALGKDPAAIIGKVLWDEFPHPPNEVSIRHAMSERVPVVDELYYAPLGEWVENHWYPSDDGGLITYQRYITDRKRSDEAVRRSEVQLAEGQRISHTGSWSWNAGSGELNWSAEHFRIWGLDPAQPQPTAARVVGMAHAEDQPRMWRVWEEAVGERRDFDCEFRIVRPDGFIRYVHSLGRPVLDGSGGLLEYVGTVVDLTERRSAEQALLAAREELGRVNRAMTVGELTASIAHELNQPLAAVVANASACERWLAASPVNEPEARAALRRIVRDANRASDVIARIRALLIRRGPQKAELRLGELIAEVMSLVESQAREKGIALGAAVEGTLPLLRADRVQIQQVLLNLLLNSMEALGASSASRAIEVSARRRGAAVAVAVRDSGRGLDARHIERVFEAFFSTKREGMGMGLAICRSIIEAHGGEIRATNNDGGGATFEFTLPL